VINFNPEKIAPLSMTNRAGNTDLEFNMNSHLRPYNQVYIVSTEPSGVATAKALDFKPPSEEKDEEDLGLTIEFTRPMRGFAKDCWFVKSGDDGNGGPPMVMTICKSSTDEYLNADCLVPLDEPEPGKVMKTLSY